MNLGKLSLSGLMAATLLIAGCAPTTKSVHEDKNVQVEAQQNTLESYTGPKLRVGVVNFKNNTPRKIVGIEQAATDILTTLLQESGRFIVIPQQDLESILEQQALGDSGVISANTAAQMGKVLGLNAILTGSITSYSEAAEGSSMLLGSSKTQIARVGVDYRVVDTTTGIQLLAASGKGEFQKTSGGFLGIGSKSTYDSSLRDGALRDALAKTMNNITSQLSQDRWSGRVAQAKGNMVYINAGKRTGLKPGMELVVQELGEEITDPQTGVLIGRAPGRTMGRLRVTGFFGDDGSVTEIIQGSGFKANDLVKLAE